MITDSFELLVFLREKGCLKELKDPLWWPDSGTYKVVVGAILTQQTKWEKVEKSLKNLEKEGINSLEDIAKLDNKTLATLIKPSGFYNTKAKYLLGVSRAVINEFGDFSTFQREVRRDWLLSLKGLGEESVDSILCYGCKKDYMVVDSYTNRLLEAFGYEFESYEEIAIWMREGVSCNLEKIFTLYEKEMKLYEIYALFHGEIVEYCKKNSRGKKVII